MASELIDHVGCEGYSSGADLAARTDWVVSGTIPVVSNTVYNITNEQWFDFSAFDYIQRTTDAGSYAIVNTQKEFELSAAFYITSNVSSSAQQLMYIDIGAIDLQLYVALNPNNNVYNMLQYRANYSSGGDTDVTELIPSVKFENGQLHYLTIRIRAQTSDVTTDGAWEIWGNGLLLASATGVTWSTSLAAATFDGTLSLRVNCPNSFAFDARNISLHNGWTSADTVAPTYKHIFDASPDSGTIGTYTNEGGATDFIEAVSDQLDTTYVKGTAPSAVIEYVINPPAELVGGNMTDAKVSIRAGRESADLNAIDLDLANSIGTQLGTINTNLSAVDPAREDIHLYVTPTTVESADNLKIQITNGS